MNTDGILTTSELIFLGVFAILVFVVPVLVVWASYSDKSQLDMRSLWMHKGQIDKLAVIIMGTWWVHTCSMILEVLNRVVTTADFATYTLWALPLLAKMFSPSGAAPSIPIPEVQQEQK